MCYLLTYLQRWHEKKKRRGRDVGQGGARADSRAAAQSGVEEPQVPPRRRQPWRQPPPQPLQPPRPPSPPPTSPSWPGRPRQCAAAKRGLQQSRPPQPAGPAVQATRPAKRQPRRTPMNTPTRPPLPPHRWTLRTPRNPRTPPIMRLPPATHGPDPGRRRGRRADAPTCRRADAPTRRRADAPTRCRAATLTARTSVTVPLPSCTVLRWRNGGAVPAGSERADAGGGLSARARAIGSAGRSRPAALRDGAA